MLDRLWKCAAVAAATLIATAGTVTAAAAAPQPTEQSTVHLVSFRSNAAAPASVSAGRCAVGTETLSRFAWCKHVTAEVDVVQAVEGDPTVIGTVSFAPVR